MLSLQTSVWSVTREVIYSCVTGQGSQRGRDSQSLISTVQILTHSIMSGRSGENSGNVSPRWTAQGSSREFFYYCPYY